MQYFPFNEKDWNEELIEKKIRQYANENRIDEIEDEESKKRAEKLERKMENKKRRSPTRGMGFGM